MIVNSGIIAGVNAKICWCSFMFHVSGETMNPFPLSFPSRDRESRSRVFNQVRVDSSTLSSTTVIYSPCHPTVSRLIHSPNPRSSPCRIPAGRGRHRIRRLWILARDGLLVCALVQGPANDTASPRSALSRPHNPGDSCRPPSNERRPVDTYERTNEVKQEEEEQVSP